MIEQSVNENSFLEGGARLRGLVIPSEAEGSCHETFKLTQRTPPLSLGMTAGGWLSIKKGRDNARPSNFQFLLESYAAFL
ncbi:MAG: hypothetical protein DME43_02405 [Verrucomicrobia bacterium]|nr:MAG: hypothetical protein DME43_02405 [Verrucomicrobiota bacterium]PYK72222.1 MAG: hypothetical protein DME44_05130 [Verrucomicrobiota bacterium]